MEDRNKDLPLIVSEMLIELHEIKEDTREVKIALQQMASLSLKQQQNTNDQFRLLLEENRKNAEFIVSAFREEARETRRRLDDHEERIIKLGNK